MAHVYAAKENMIAPVMEQPHYNLFQRERVEVEYSRLYGEVGLGRLFGHPWHEVNLRGIILSIGMVPLLSRMRVWFG